MIALEIAFGLALGYGLASLIESIWHEYIPDAPPRLLAIWRRHPRLFRLLLQVHFYHHVVHHHRTYRTNHVTQFDSPEQRAKLEAFLLRRGPPGQVIIRNGFANRLHTEALPEFSVPWISVVLAIALVAPASVVLPAAVALVLPGFFSYSIHPYLHMPFAEGQRLAPPIVARLLRTQYVKAVYRNHFMHHRYGGTGNYNLVLGADYVRGRLRTPTDGDLHAMREVGMPVE